MITFKEWTTRQQPDFHELEQIYNKAHISVLIVEMYNPDILKNIATIANLASGAYGVYNSGEVKKELPQDLEKKLIYTGKVQKQDINKIPNFVLKQYYPNIDESKIKESDVIRVNVKRILNQAKTPFEIIIQIASTIIHEATHANEMQQKGTTNETGPQLAEKNFMNWVKLNSAKIRSKFPELNLLQNNK